MCCLFFIAKAEGGKLIRECSQLSITPRTLQMLGRSFGSGTKRNLIKSLSFSPMWFAGGREKEALMMAN